MRIFIASSGDLAEEREKLELLCYRRKFTPLLWENIDQSITTEKFQDRINNNELDESDVVIFMIKSKLGKYTQEEFDEVYKKVGKKLYVYFFHIDMNILDKAELFKILELQNFLKEKGDLYKEVNTFTDLEVHFLNQEQYFSEKKKSENIKNELVILDSPTKFEMDDTISKIAILYSSPINEDYSSYLSLDKIQSYFIKYKLNIDLHILNLDSIYNLENYSDVFIFAKINENSIIIEDDNFLSTDLIYEDLEEISRNNVHMSFHLFSLNNYQKENIFKYFNLIYFYENHTKSFNAYLYKSFRQKFKQGKAKVNNNHSFITDYFNISKDLNTFVGRKHDIRNVIRDVLNIKGKNKIYTILASGGIGKTTLVKKIANDFAFRGYFRDGYYFIDCEHLKDYGDFEEKIKIAFQMNNAINFIEQLRQVSEKDRMIVLDNFETLLHIDLVTDIKKIKNLIFNITYYSTIILTSREKINEEYEEVYPLNYDLSTLKHTQKL